MNYNFQYSTWPYFWVGVLCTVFCVGLCVCMMCLHKVIELIFLFVRLYSVYTSIAGVIIIGSKKSTTKNCRCFPMCPSLFTSFVYQSLSFLSAFSQLKSNTILSEQEKKLGINNCIAKYIIYMLLCVNV